MIHRRLPSSLSSHQSGSVFLSLLLMLAVMLAGFLDSPLADETSPKTYKGRAIAPPMSYRGAGWLDRSDRDAVQQPEKVLDALHIQPGSTVADIGAGTGYFSLRLAKRVGDTGRVLATDIQPQMLAILKDNMRAAGISNIELILCTPSDAKLPDNRLDLVLMVDVYHELEYPEETLAQVQRALRPTGRLVLVEYRGEDPNVPIKPDHKTTLVQLRHEIEPLGWKVLEVLEFLEQQRIIVFGKRR